MEGKGKLECNIIDKGVTLATVTLTGWRRFAYLNLTSGGKCWAAVAVGSAKQVPAGHLSVKYGVQCADFIGSC